MTRRRVAAACVLALASRPLRAHGPADVVPSGFGAAFAHWTFDPWIVVPLFLAATLYIVGAWRLHRRGARRAWPHAAYAAGWLALAGALVSPLHWLGERVFTFHMIEHEVVMAVAAPLLVLARPGGTLLWALPAAARHAIGRAIRAPGVAAGWQLASTPVTATLLHGIAIWAWHAPPWFDAALRHEALHRLQHLSFFASALLFWWALVRRRGSGVPVWHVFVTMLHTSVLGAWIALLPRVAYRLQTEDAPAFGLTPLEDQQLAGIVMWIPVETVYAGAALAFAALWMRQRRVGRPGAGLATPAGGAPP